MKKQNEYILQRQICNYLSVQYPKILFLSSGMSIKLTLPQQVRNKAIQKKGFKCPDLIIFEPKGNYCGLFIELKIESPYKLNGQLKKDAHLEAQQKTMMDLKSKGYDCHFAWNFEMAAKIIDTYLKLKK